MHGEPFKLVWAKHVWNLVCDLTWPFASLNLLLWGTHGSGVNRGVFIPFTICNGVCAPWGCWGLCLLVKCHDSAKFKRQETELDGSLVWSQETNPLLWLLSEAGDCWGRWGEEAESEKSVRWVFKIRPALLPAPTYYLHICTSHCSQCYFYVCISIQREFLKVPRSEAQRGTMKQVAEILE